MLTGQGAYAIFPIRNMKAIKDSAELGAAIRAERKRLKVTQKELAMAAGTGLRYLIELERGKPTSRIDGVFKVLQALGIKLTIETTGSSEGAATT
jgi:y4mF family transcriptional regulator